MSRIRFVELVTNASMNPKSLKILGCYLLTVEGATKQLKVLPETVIQGQAGLMRPAFDGRRAIGRLEVIAPRHRASPPANH